jgi:uncharacterized heparinase superfamily protein
MTSLTWKINRLKLMGAPELAWRVRQLVQKKASKLGVGLVSSPPEPSLDRFGAAFVAHAKPNPGVRPTGSDPVSADVGGRPLGSDPGFRLSGRAALVAAADDVLAGRWNVFAMRGMQLGFPPNWNRDPKTGTVAPMKLGKAIDYRSEHIVGDIKYLWEPSRHLELVTLAAAFRATGEQRYADAAKQLLQSWFDQCPYAMGVHWTSSLELAVRLLNWAFAWQLLGDEVTKDQAFQRKWLDNIYQHCHFIRGYFSRHSSANNHLFGEYMGLYVASLQWPCWKESQRWHVIARRGLETEALKQNAADGVNKEQAIYYHHEVMDMMLLCQHIGAANNDSFSQAYLQRLERMADFVAALMDCGGNVPMTGDADDAQMVRLSYEPDWSPYRSLLASCALLFKRPDFKAKAATLDDKNRWLFGTDGEVQWQTMPAAGPEHPVMAFPEGGYYLLGKDFGTPQEVRMVIDCAPLGYLSIAAHGHADALAFTLSHGGEELLIDPGTYAYHTQKSWRDYFRGTSAHNTVQVDGKDQSEIGGNFMWLRKAHAELVAHRADGKHQLFEGTQDGYRRLEDAVLHRRIVAFDSNRNGVVVKDILECTGDHEVAVQWHFAEKCSVQAEGRSVWVRAKSKGLRMSCSFGNGPALLHCSMSPLAGWISRKFDEKAGITTAVWRGRISGTTEIVTEIVLLAGS